MPKIVGVEDKAHVVVSMYHLVRERIFEVGAIAQFVGADEDAVLAVEAAGLGGGAALASHVVGSD